MGYLGLNVYLRVACHRTRVLAGLKAWLMGAFFLGAMAALAKAAVLSSDLQGDQAPPNLAWPKGAQIILPEPGASPASFQPREPENDFEVQLALVRNRFSPGSLDGLIGPQTREAILAFQIAHHLPQTGEVDPLTRRFLVLHSPPLTTFLVTSTDLARLRSLPNTWLGKSQQDRLDYQGILEMAAECSQAHPNLIQQLNPNCDWTRIVPGMALAVPNALYPIPDEKAAFIRIFLSRRILQVYGAQTNLLAHFPCSIARRAEKRPVGRLEVAVVAEDPNYTFNPKIFPESAEGRQLGRKLILPPGPNNPVGVAWIGLNQPGYGIHGTPEPEKVGRTESHGCFRLANWNAAYLVQLAWVSMPVFVEP